MNVMYAAVVSDRYCDVNTSKASTNCRANPMASPAVLDTVKATTAGFGDSSFSSLSDSMAFVETNREGIPKKKSNHVTTTCRIFVEPTKIKFRTSAKIVPAKKVSTVS